MEHLKKRGKLSNRSNDIRHASWEVCTWCVRTKGVSTSGTASLSPARAWCVNGMAKSQRIDPEASRAS